MLANVDHNTKINYIFTTSDASVASICHNNFAKYKKFGAVYFTLCISMRMTLFVDSISASLYIIVWTLET